MGWEYAFREANKKNRKKGDGRNNGGSTMYGRTYGSNKEPQGAQGEFNPRTGEGHSTQYYDDNTRLSWDTDGNKDTGHHWTDQNVKNKKNPRRHEPPGHAK